MAVKRATSEGINDPFNFGSNHIATDKIGIVENGAEETLSQEVLHEHLIDDILADLWVKRSTAEFGKGIEGRDELLILLVFFLNDRQQCPCKFRDTLLEFLYRYLEGGDIRLGVGEELREKINHFGGIMQIVLKGPFFVLVEYRSLGVFKDGVDQRIPCCDLFGDLFVKVTLWPFGFPKAALQVKAIAEHAIRPDTALDRL